MSQRAQEEDDITSGDSKKYDVGFVKVPTELTNLQLKDQGSLNINTLHQNMSVEKSKHASKLRDDINRKESSEKNQKLFSKINAKLQDKTFIEQAIEQVNVHEGADDEVTHSDELAPGDQGFKNTDRMSELDKISEDAFRQGGEHPANGEPQAESNHLPNGGVQVADSHMPHHHDPTEHHDPSIAPSSASGISVAYLTVDSEEHASRFVRELFRHKLVAQV
mmetsp:Transcript_15819/g.24350  ORF Transcript_15819/g.24350 Transcript_15819/m.24350 type:complete len:221 (-) Transcript_15819:320-982(-)